jgi:hypothetical protein
MPKNSLILIEGVFESEIDVEEKVIQKIWEWK